MKKKDKIIVLGTSHVYDNNYNDLYRTKWTEYLGKQLNREVINCGRSSYGIETYFPRIQNIINNHKNFEMLIEVPSSGRYEFYFNNSFYDELTMIESENFWSQNHDQTKIDTPIEKYKGTRHAHIHSFSEGDILKYEGKVIAPFKNYDTLHQEERIKLLKKIAVRYNKSLFPTRQQFVETNKLYVARSSQIEDELILCKCVMIDAYLKSKNIKTTWFTFSFHGTSNEYKSNQFEKGQSKRKWEYELCKDMEFLYNSKPLPLYFVYKQNIAKKLNEREKYIEWWNWKDYLIKEKVYDKMFPDGTHLIKESWEELIDNVLVPHYNKNND